MKKFLVIFLIGQLLVCSFIYGKSIYDIYTLNNLGADNLNSYYLEESNGTTLEVVYNKLIQENASIEIIKEPISLDGVLEYDVYNTSDVSINERTSISSKKVFNYYTLTLEEFIDSTGKFKCNLPPDKMKMISEELGLNIKQYAENKIAYTQVVKNNAINFIVLILLSQFVLFVYTFSRIKINAIKKLNGFSPKKMIVDSFKDFLFTEIIAAAVVILIHLIYSLINHVVNTTYFIGLIVTIVSVICFNMIQLMITQISIRTINISEMLKNKYYSSFWNISMQIVKIVFVFVLAISISIFANQLKGYDKTLNSIEAYRNLSTFFTSNGYNSDENEKLNNNTEKYREISKNTKLMYENNFDKSVLIDANILSLNSSTYFELYGTSFDELLNSYSDNYVVVNQKYFEKFMSIQDVNGNDIVYPISMPTVLVPEKYKSAEVEEFCQEQYNTMVNYDILNYDQTRTEVNIPINVIYIKNDQITPLINNYLLENGKEIKNSIIFLENGCFAGTWYLEKISNGNLAFNLTDRSEYATMLSTYGLDKLLNVGTMLTPLSESIRYYEFLAYQSGIFVLLFSITLLMIIYLSDYLELIINKKKYALHFLSGFSTFKNLNNQFVIDGILLLLVIPLLLTKNNIGILFFSVLFDIICLFLLYKKLIINNISEALKGGE